MPIIQTSNNLSMATLFHLDKTNLPSNQPLKSLPKFKKLFLADHIENHTKNDVLSLNIILREWAIWY